MVTLELFANLAIQKNNGAPPGGDGFRWRFSQQNQSIASFSFNYNKQSVSL